MKNNEQKQTNLLLKVVRSIGSKSVDSKCSWWFNQPKVTKEIKERIKNK
ncbi:MAG: cyclic lactone autoinducer peptide [Anaeroplasma sp.]